MLSTVTLPAASRSAEIAAELEHDIETARLLPGQPLDERELAERFGVSRTPVREAVQQLTTRGLLRVIPRQGIFVARMSIAELRAMFEVLAELEGACAKLAARRMDDLSRSKMQDACARCVKAAASENVAAYTKANADFHEALYGGAHNMFLAEQLRSIRRRTQMYRSSFQRPGQMQRSAQDHLRVAKAVLAGDALTAQREMVEHIAVGGAGFAEFVSMLPPGMLAS
ncbi:MAG: GntR family transcriptional regulator [Ramlibacter sp.]|nr:GntR family transcriptional regulator [Ramlibacter sp.]